jgi:nucleoside-triphosphatase THEP1
MSKQDFIDDLEQAGLKARLIHTDGKLSRYEVIDLKSERSVLPSCQILIEDYGIQGYEVFVASASNTILGSIAQVLRELRPLGRV